MSFTFWQDRPGGQLSAEEYKDWQTQAGARLVKFACGVCKRAQADLPAGAVNITLPPELLPDLAPDIHHAHIAHSVLFAIVQQIPAHCPLRPDSTPGQARAWRVLERLRVAVMAARGIPADQSLPLIEAVLALGVAASRAHVEPYQGKVAGKLKIEANLAAHNQEANPARAIDAAERHAVWQQVAADIWNSHPEWSAKRVAQKIAADPETPGDNPDTIRKKIRKPH